MDTKGIPYFVIFENSDSSLKTSAEIAAQKIVSENGLMKNKLIYVGSSQPERWGAMYQLLYCPLGLRLECRIRYQPLRTIL